MRIVFLVLAILAGGAAGWLALSSRSNVAPAPPPASQIAMEDVLVAAKPLPPGRPFGREGLRWQAWPASAVNSNMIRRKSKPEALQEFAEYASRSSISENEPLQLDKVGKGGGLLSQVLAPGKRAVAVRISAESTAGGFILPNDRVDVLQTVLEANAEGDRRPATRALVRNVVVLAIDQVMDFDEKSKKTTAIGRTATLELSPEQSEIVIAAESRGRLSLALRSSQDNREEFVEEVNKTRPVRIIRGGQSETLTVPTSPQ